ncbi:hypothetical protein AAG906_018931 [Vitis piasezkii]
MTKNDIQRLSTDQLSQGQEGIPPLVQTSGTCRRLNTNLTVEMIFDTARKKTDNDSKRGGIDRQLQGVGNLENTTTNATLQANGTHSRHQNNSTSQRMTRSHSRIVGIDELMRSFGNVEDTIAPAIMDTSETPFDPNNNTSTMDADSTTGKDVGLESSGTMRCWDDKLIQANGSRPLGGVEIKPENNAPTGTIVRNYAPLDVEKWADISKVTKSRNKCHKHFKKYPTIALAKQNPYKHVSDQKQWDWLCDRFASEKFQVDHGPLYNMWKNW